MTDLITLIYMNITDLMKNADKIRKAFTSAVPLQASNDRFVEEMEWYSRLPNNIYIDMRVTPQVSRDSSSNALLPGSIWMVSFFLAHCASHGIFLIL